MICKNPGGGTPPLISLRGGNGLPPPLETAYEYIQYTGYNTYNIHDTIHTIYMIQYIHTMYSIQYIQCTGYNT